MRFLQLWFLDRDAGSVLFRKRAGQHEPPIIVKVESDDPLWWVEELHTGVDMQLGKNVSFAIMEHCKTTALVHTYGIGNDDVYAYLARLPLEKFEPDADKASDLVWVKMNELNAVQFDPYHKRVAEKIFEELSPR